MARTIFLDHNSTTQLDPAVFECMRPLLIGRPGNPTSDENAPGREAGRMLEEARRDLAAALGAASDEIIFTSGATESINIALRGLAPRATSHGKKHAVATATEHSAVLDTLKHCEACGLDVEILSVDSNGMLDLDALRNAIRPETLFVTAIWANNEIGTINPVREIAALCAEHGVIFHTDATQAVGIIDMDLSRSCIDMLSASAHKFHGPAGAGFLYVKGGPARLALEPVLFGGGQERGLRPGTPNLPAIVGMAHALKLAASRRGDDAARMTRLRLRVLDALADVDAWRLNGHPTSRLPGNLNITFDCVDAEALLISMPEIALSTGAACSSSKKKLSHVLKAIGLSDKLVRSSIRIGIGRATTDEEIDYFCRRLTAEIKRLRSVSADYMLTMRASG